MSLSKLHQTVKDIWNELNLQSSFAEAFISSATASSAPPYGSAPRHARISICAAGRTAVGGSSVSGLITSSSGVRHGEAVVIKTSTPDRIDSADTIICVHQDSKPTLKQRSSLKSAYASLYRGVSSVSS